MELLSPEEALSAVPHPLTVITAGRYDDPSNRGGMTAAWLSRVSWEPALLAVSVAPQRHTLKLIREFNEFAVNLVSRRLLKAALTVFGSLSGQEVDKFSLAGLRVAKGLRISAPVILEAPIVIECSYLTEVAVGDHVIVVGEVLVAYKNSEDEPLIWHEHRAKSLGAPL